MILQGDFEKSQGIRYEFDRFQKSIGEGGMGIVYKGVMIDDNTGAVLRDVAIKEVKAEGSHTEVNAILQKAQREASIRLHNDNLVEMLGFIEVEETKLKFSKRRYYVVSEFLTGVTLSDILAGKFLDYKGDIVEYAQQLGAELKTDREHTSYYIIKNILYGITALHDNGYIHRDIDPSNIMVTNDGRIKLIDFGIAKQLNDLNAQDEKVINGSFIGKVEYAAPELIGGRISEHDFTTDIYGIGVLFYKILTGRLPFDGNRFEIMNSHLKKNVNTRVISNKKFADIIKKAMKKKRELRFQTSSEMRVALDQPPVPDRKWIWLTVMAIVVAISAYKYWSSVEEPVLEDNDTTGHVITRPQLVDSVDFTLLSKDELWKEIDKDPNNPHVLFALARKYKDVRIEADSDAQHFWDNYLVPEGYVEKNISVPSRREITSERFVFIVLTKAMDNAKNDQLKKNILNDLNEFIDQYQYYRYTPMSNDNINH